MWRYQTCNSPTPHNACSARGHDDHHHLDGNRWESWQGFSDTVGDSAGAAEFLSHEQAGTRPHNESLAHVCPWTFNFQTSFASMRSPVAGPAVILGIQITIALYRELTEAAHAVDIYGRALTPKACITTTASKYLSFGCHPKRRKSRALEGTLIAQSSPR